ncbi:hypothetical protein D0N36_14420 [Hymenobacter lapidiphilus]|uniref:hypothetical protein n=1 Tax=Hymenobacter sp. CCM 8763 TaxID=2303334 RepID=UPI000E3415E9|nr:hypothetical protein [Hymenobacter sp. CCM 8763]RFP64380.1 hypothetical protein D0N36_14420 [Hymenobacter sp. CCM 8763]
MRRTHWLFFVLLLSFGQVEAPVAAQQRRPVVDTIAVHFPLPGADCALFPAKAALPPWNPTAPLPTKRFTPSRGQVRAVEKALQGLSLERVNERPETGYYAGYAALIKQHLPDYQRQYFGFYSPQGHRCFFINFFVERLDEPAGYVPRWLRTPMITHDGGSAYWSIFYDLTTRTFYQFEHNVEG